MTAQLIAAIAAVCLLVLIFRGEVLYAVESVVGAVFSDDGDHKPAKRRGPSYQQAMLDMAAVRLRLVETSALSPEATAAIETLTLALLAGSDK